MLTPEQLAAFRAVFKKNPAAPAKDVTPSPPCTGGRSVANIVTVPRRPGSKIMVEKGVCADCGNQFPPSHLQAGRVPWHRT